MSIGKYALVLKYKDRSQYSTFYGGIFTILALLIIAIIVVVIFTPVFMMSHYNIETQGYGFEAYKLDENLVMKEENLYCNNEKSCRRISYKQLFNHFLNTSYQVYFNSIDHKPCEEMYGLLTDWPFDVEMKNSMKLIANVSFSTD